jgi:hypothetical protein
VGLADLAVSVVAGDSVEAVQGGVGKWQR